MSKLEILNDVSLSDYTTLKVGGRAKFFLKLTNERQLLEISNFIKEKGIVWFVLGGGSNILFSNQRFNGLVIKNELKGSFLNKENIWEVSAGENWDSWVEETVKNGWNGVENLSGIPGTVGAAPVQNINAYGATVADVIYEVEVFSLQTNSFIRLKGKECRFSYRDSIFKHNDGKNFIITKVFFKLKKAGVLNFDYASSSQGIKKFFEKEGVSKPTALDVRRAVLHLRSNIGMLPGQFNSAGSFFKNTIVDKRTFQRIKGLVEIKFADKDKMFSPWYWEIDNNQIKISTAFLLECTNFNKHTYGNYNWRSCVGLSPLHSLSIVTKEKAKFEDVISFVEAIDAEVFFVFSVHIEPEVIFVDKS